MRVMISNIFINLMKRIKTSKNKNKTKQQKHVEASAAISEKELGDFSNDNDRDEMIDMHSVYEGNLDGDYWIDDDKSNSDSHSDSRCKYDIFLSTTFFF